MNQPDLFLETITFPSGRILEPIDDTAPDSFLGPKFHLGAGSAAIFSACRRYRFELWRRWAPGPYCMFLCLNPSTADETKNDPTVTRCIDYAKRWGYSAFVMTNIFAFRATDPRVMKAEANPIGCKNDETIIRLAEGAGVVVAAWGVHGDHLDRGGEVVYILEREGFKRLTCLRKTRDGHPSHPLYLPKTLTPIPFP